MARQKKDGADTVTTTEGQAGDAVAAPAPPTAPTAPAATPTAPAQEERPEYVTQILQAIQGLQTQLGGLDDKIKNTVNTVLAEKETAKNAAQDVVKQQDEVKNYLKSRIATVPKGKKELYDNIRTAATTFKGNTKYITVDDFFKQDLNDAQKATYDAIPQDERRKWIDGLYTTAPATSAGKGKTDKPKVISEKKGPYKVSSMFSNYSTQLEEQALLYDAAGGVETVKGKVWTDAEKAKGNVFNQTCMSDVAILGLEAMLNISEDKQNGMPLKEFGRTRLKELITAEVFYAFMHPKTVKEVGETIKGYYNNEDMQTIIGKDDLFANDNSVRDIFETYLRISTVTSELFSGKVPKKQKKVDKKIVKAVKSMYSTYCKVAESMGD